MISDVLEMTKAKYVAQLNDAKAKRDAEINAKCDALRQELLAEPNHEIESLEKVIADLEKLIEREKADEQPKQEIVEEKVEVEQDVEPIVDAEPIADAEPIEQVVEEQEIEQPVAEEIADVEPIAEPKVEVKEVKVEKQSAFKRFMQSSKIEKKVVEQPKQEIEQPKIEQPKIVKVNKPRVARAGMESILNPKRR